ncbi:hypothetical protein DL767_011378 [Monosporascus sp. MG133]|nr:hypothetical protein DL767_011378 [Monosporascus sp. MG133]
MSGVTDQAGQANYSGANTSLDTFVRYRTGLGLACSAPDIGAVQDVGYVSQDEALLKTMKALGAETSHEEYLDKDTLGLDRSTNVPLNSKESRAFWRRDRRMAVYHNNASKSAAEAAGTSGSDGLKEIGRKLFSFLLRSDEDLNTSVPLSRLGMDSLAAESSMRPAASEAELNPRDADGMRPLRSAVQAMTMAPGRMSFTSTVSSDVDLRISSLTSQALDDRVPSSTVSFFSNDRVTSLTDRLGTESLRELVEDLDDLIKKCRHFCDTFDSYLDDVLRFNPAFSALHHSILALSSQFFWGKSFVPHAGQAWDLFQVSLGKLSEILAPPVALVNLQSSLFSVSASLKSKAACATAITRVRHLLNDWRASVPSPFRPGEAVQHDLDLISSAKLVLLQTQYAYYNVVFALERLAIQIDREEGRNCEESKVNLMNAARSVVELIVFIDFEPQVPILHFNSVTTVIEPQRASVATKFGWSTRQREED